MKNRIFDIVKKSYLDVSIKTKYRFNNTPYMLDFLKVPDQEEFFEEISDIANTYSTIFSPEYSKSYHCVVASLYIGEIKSNEKYVFSIININSDFFKKLYDNKINTDLSPFKAFTEMYKELPYEMRLKTELNGGV